MLAPKLACQVLACCWPGPVQQMGFHMPSHFRSRRGSGEVSGEVQAACGWASKAAVLMLLFFLMITVPADRLAITSLEAQHWQKMQPGQPGQNFLSSDGTRSPALLRLPESGSGEERDYRRGAPGRQTILPVLLGFGDAWQEHLCFFFPGQYDHYVSWVK